MSPRIQPLTFFPFMPRTSKQTIAYHEAGHAVADHVLGFKIKDVTIVPKEGTLGAVTSLRPWRFSDRSGVTLKSIAHFHGRIISALAGKESQRRFSPKSIRTHQAASDYDTVGDLLLRLHGEETEASLAFKYLQARTRNLVSHPQKWRQIQDLASALLEHQTLSGQEVKAVLRASLQVQMQEDRRNLKR